MVPRVVADLVYMSTSSLFTPISSGTATEASFSFLAVPLLKFLPMWLSVLLKLSKSVFKPSLILQRACLMPSLSYTPQEASLGYFPFSCLLSISAYTSITQIFFHVVALALLAVFTGGYYHFGVEIFHVIKTMSLQISHFP